MKNEYDISEATTIDGTCEDNAQCSTPFPNTECNKRSNKCACKNSFVLNAGKTKCLACEYFSYILEYFSVSKSSILFEE
jgi:hypothetical protein